MQNDPTSSCSDSDDLSAFQREQLRRARLEAIANKVTPLDPDIEAIILLSVAGTDGDSMSCNIMSPERIAEMLFAAARSAGVCAAVGGMIGEHLLLTEYERQARAGRLNGRRKP